MMQASPIPYSLFPIPLYLLPYTLYLLKKKAAEDSAAWGTYYYRLDETINIIESNAVIEFVHPLIQKMYDRYFFKAMHFPWTILVSYAIDDLVHCKYFIDGIRIYSCHAIPFYFSHRSLVKKCTFT